jgi:DNA-binding response OmpR family regulator
VTVKKTILCVDDEQSLSIQKVTLETRGYRVMTSHTVLGAVTLLGLGSVDLVLSGMDLPDASAAVLVKRIKSHSPELPVILLSSPLRALDTDAPADLLLKKGSYAPAELLEGIRILLVKRRGPHRAMPHPVDRRAPIC